MARLSSSDDATLQQRRLMKRLIVWGGILIALMIAYYLIFHGPFPIFRKVVSAIPDADTTSYAYATPEVVAQGIPRPPAGYEWVKLNEWNDTGRRHLGRVLLNYQWAVIWTSGDLNPQGADPEYRRQNPDAETPRMALYRENTEIGLTTMPREVGKVRGVATGYHNFSVVTGNIGWRVRLYEMRPVR